jgi:pyruvate/2-oxoglutarate dehydrogenase complex dihydrolipoamide acyltransferase (E2) component
MSEIKNKKKWGDRRDGKRIKVSAMAKLMTYIKNREEAYVYINRKFDVTELVKYMKKKKEKNPDLTYFHAFSMAISKVIYNRPRLNYFIINNNCYERNDVILSFVARVTFDDGGKEVMSLIKIDEDDTIDDISKKIKDKVNSFRKDKNQTSTDDSMDLLGKLPNWTLKFIVAPVAKWMDRHDLLPKSLTSDLIYNSTVILVNLGSIKCGAIHHHLLDFGTNGIIFTMGEIHKEPMVINDKVEIRDVVEFGITLDERIADGVYFFKSVNLLDYILSNPKMLEEKANEIIKEKKDFEY